MKGNGPVFDFTDRRQWMPKFLPLLNTDKRKRVLYGSRGDGKSTVCAQCLMMDLLDSSKDIRGLMVRKRANSIKESQVAAFKMMIARYGFEEYFSISETTNKITAYNGNCLIALGMDDPGKAKSIPNPNRLWIEEADELTEEDYRQLSLSLRGDEVVEYLAFNAPYLGHWLLGRFFPGTWADMDGTPHFELDLSFEQPDGNFTVVDSPDPNVFLIHGNYLQNPFCSENIKQDMERDRLYHPEDYRRTGLGLIGRRNLGSLWMRAFDRNKQVRPVQYDPNYPIHLSFDQNNLPYSTMICIQAVPIGDLMEIRVFRNYCLKPPSNTTEDLCMSLVYDYGEHEFEAYYYGDTTGRNETQRKERAELAHHYDAVDKHLAPYLNSRSRRVASSAPSIKGRQRFMTVMLREGTYLRFVVDPSCKEMIGDFEHLVEDTNGGYIKKRVKDKETDQTWEERGHCMDSLINYIYQAHTKLYKAVARV